MIYIARCAIIMTKRERNIRKEPEGRFEVPGQGRGYLLVPGSAVAQQQAEGVALAAVPGTRQNREVRKVAGQMVGAG